MLNIVKTYFTLLVLLEDLDLHDLHFIISFNAYLSQYSSPIPNIWNAFWEEGSTVNSLFMS